MYILRVRDHFDAAHFLPWHEGKCKNLHGHRWEVEVEIEAQELSDNGIVIDFAIVKGALKEVLPDHCDLNKHISNPTAENLSRVIFTHIRAALHNAALDGNVPVKCELNQITVWESPNCSVTYRPEET